MAHNCRSSAQFLLVVLFLFACRPSSNLASYQAVETSPMPEPTPTCYLLPQPTGEKYSPANIETSPPAQTSPGQQISIRFSEGYGIIPNNAKVCGEEIVGYVHSDQLPSFSPRRTVQLFFDGRPLTATKCDRECEINLVIPADTLPGIHRLDVQMSSLSQVIFFDIEIIDKELQSGTPTPFVVVSTPVLPMVTPGSIPQQAEVGSVNLAYTHDPIDYEEQLLAYLNDQNPPDDLQHLIKSLKETDKSESVFIKAQVLIRELNGKAPSEIIVYIRHLYTTLYSSEALFIFARQNSAYETIHRERLVGQTQGEVDGIRTVQDMNANGTPEIVFSYISNIGNAGRSREFRIIEWNGNQFVDLVPPHTIQVYKDFGQSDSEETVRDVDGNGTLELVVTNAVTGGMSSCDGGPQRSETEIWMWNGQEFALARREYPPPEYRFQAVRDGDNASAAGLYEKALTFYRQAIFDESLKPGSRADWLADIPAYCAEPFSPPPDSYERPRLEAYAYYRIIVLQVVQGVLSQAEETYNTVQQEFPNGRAGHQYAELARVFWEAYSREQNIERACAQAIAYSSDHVKEIIHPLGSRVYGWQNPDYEPEEICLFR